MLQDEAASRHHARIERRGENWIVMDVGSTNGTLVNEEKLESLRILRNGDRIKIGSTILKYLRGTDVEAAFHEEIYQLAITDPLTRLPNRRRFDEVLATEVTRVRRHKRTFSLLLLDVDLFKRVNDQYGHPSGDSVLTHVATLLRERVRGEDLAARVGGEEFAVLMPETPIAGAIQLAETLRGGVEESTVDVGDDAIRVTVSIGCAEFGPEDAAASDLYSRCDAKMYEAKKSGRNRVAS